MGMNSFNPLPQPNEKPEEQVEKQETDPSIEAEKERLTQELKNENKSVEYCEKRVQEDGEKYDEHMILADTPDKWGTKGGFDRSENLRWAQVYLDDKKVWDQKSEECKARRLDIERKLAELG